MRSGENGGAGTESTVRERGRDPLLWRSSKRSPERKCVARAWSLALCDDIGWPRGEASPCDANLSMLFSAGANVPLPSVARLAERRSVTCFFVNLLSKLDTLPRC